MNTTSTMTDQLYDDLGLDYTSLNWAEQQWVAWYKWIDNPVVATGLMSFLMHEIVYFGRCIPWMIVDATPYFNRWKLQPLKVPTLAEQWECTRMVLFSHFTIELPAIWLFHPMAQLFGMETYQVPFPPWQLMAQQILLFFFFEDLFHWCAHSLLHKGVFYKHIHKVHHKYPAPFGLCAEYAHPAEVFILGAGTIFGPILYCYFTHNLHVFTVYIWITLRLFQAVDAHSGYDFPWSLNKFIPFWAGAEHHDFHHMAFSNNFATSFRWWDWALGTDKKYREHVARVKAAKAALQGKGASREELVRAQYQLMKQAEEEGAVEEAEVCRTASFKFFKTD
ncbi:hypothetical protein EV122DRAFT_293190 [Schizophyllum commune]|nr:hypothetical protein K523DRAFT_366412 [Schizophyllum commune Tattone D]